MLFNINPYKRAKESFDYIKTHLMKHIAAFFIIFIIAIAVGVLAAPDTKKSYYEALKSSDIAKTTSEKDSLYLASYIIIHNNLIAFAIVASGILLALFAMLQIAGLGIILGILGSFLFSQTGNLAKVIMAILPHGIFEIPAILIASAFAFDIFANAVKERNLQSIKENYYRAFNAFFFIIMPTLVVAGIVEGFITVYLVSLL